MKKKLFSKAIALAMCALTLVPATACGGGKDGEQVDHTKTQLHVYHYFAGFGDEWLIELKQNFEEAFKEVSFEEGKMGVQVHHKGDMGTFTSSSLKSSSHDVFFLEGPDDFRNIMAEGCLEPLDTIMTTPNVNDNNQTIESKMAQQQKDYYKFRGEHYYGIPHYMGNYGIVYNKSLFDAKGLYLAAEPGDSTDLITADNPTKSVGPDGKAGTADDGLPRTYEEFFTLCAEIDLRGVDPVCFPGAYAEYHLTNLVNNLSASNMGAEEMLLNYSFTGTANDLVVFDANGNPVKEGGQYVTESMEINEENAYNLSRQIGKYYAMEFVQELLDNTDYYNEEDGTNSNLSHTANQQRFVENWLIGKKPSAMLVDGVWWQIESDWVFEYLEAENENWSKDVLEFGWMPLPQPTEAEAEKIANGTKNTVFCDYLNAVACVKSGLSDGVKNAALEFLKYAYTDKALADFTYTTGTTIGVDYLDAVDRNKLNYYVGSLVDYLEQSDVIFQVSGNEHYAKNIENLTPDVMYGAGSHRNPIRAFLDTNMTAEDYFKEHQLYYQSRDW